jgi:hypothetical protein
MIRTDTGGERVSLVIDPILGAKGLALIERGPVWLIESPANRRAAEQLWRRDGVPPGWVTVFTPEGDTAEEIVTNLLATVAEHHPLWRRLEVIGAGFTETIGRQLRHFGRGKAEATRQGFVWSRD